MKSMMRFYGLTGAEWETGGYSSHVDWSRQTAGHPGAYTRLMLRRGPDVVRKVRCNLAASTLHCKVGCFSSGTQLGLSL